MQAREIQPFAESVWTIFRRLRKVNISFGAKAERDSS
jgi:hypothetical protein